MWKKLNSNVKQFSDSTSIHGIARITGTLSRNLCDKLIWALVLITAAAFGLTQIQNLYTQWRSNPVTTAISSVTKEISSIDFPAITVCKSGANLAINRNAFLKRYNLTEETVVDKLPEWKSTDNLGKNSIVSNYIAQWNVS